MSKKLIHVAAAVIKNGDGQILIAKRSADQHQGGLWEFPGGKVEPGEPVPVALARELEEELGIEVTHSSPLIKVPHHYADKSVLLDVYEVTQFNGEAWGREGQPVEWVNPGDLDQFQFPAANKPILNTCLLPDSWFITPEHISEVDEFIKKIDQAQQQDRDNDIDHDLNPLLRTLGCQMGDHFGHPHMGAARHGSGTAQEGQPQQKKGGDFQRPCEVETGGAAQDDIGEDQDQDRQPANRQEYVHRRAEHLQRLGILLTVVQLRSSRLR